MTDSIDTFKEFFFRKHDFYKIIILLLQKGEPVEIILTGHCMKPLLCEGDLISIHPMQVNALRCGDIAIFHINGRIKAHRFLRFILVDGTQHLLTKSDRKHRYDPPVPVTNFLGTITQVKRNSKIMDYETMKWKVINLLRGGLSSYIWSIERPIVFLLRLHKRAAKKVFFAVLPEKRIN